MANLVIARSDEYTKLLTDLHTIHKDAVSAINTNIQQIRALAGRSGDFQAGLVSDKINALLDMMDKDVMGIAALMFKETEVSVSSFCQTLENTDTVC